MNFFDVLFGNLITLTIGFAAIAIMVALAIKAVRNISRNEEEKKKKNPPKDL